MRTAAVLLIGLLALSGCNNAAKQDPAAGTAQGEVLPGSASDAMLPLDTVKSQAPLAPKTEGGDASNGSDPKAASKSAAKAAKPAALSAPDEPAPPAPSADETQ